MQLGLDQMRRMISRLRKINVNQSTSSAASKKLVKTTIKNNSQEAFIKQQGVIGKAIWCLPDTFCGQAEAKMKIYKSPNYQKSKSVFIKADESDGITEILRFFTGGYKKGQSRKYIIDAQTGIVAKGSFNEAGSLTKLKTMYRDRIFLTKPNSSFVQRGKNDELEEAIKTAHTEAYTELFRPRNK